MIFLIDRVCICLWSALKVISYPQIRMLCMLVKLEIQIRQILSQKGLVTMLIFQVTKKDQK
ncbi:hypothetical protein AO390_22160 [Pseudomonas marginalis ICMP 11289]|nr:hypothetical protein AO390_22160 [Pseudomonas marginalis ICMP 11289]